MKSNKAILQYLKERTEELGTHAGYYEALERDRGYMTIDQQTSYNLAISRLNEIEKLVRFIEK